MLRPFIARMKMAVEPDALPRSLRSVADARAARATEKIGHSGRDDRKGKFAPLHRAALPTLCHPERSSPICSSAPQSGASGCAERDRGKI